MAILASSPITIQINRELTQKLAIPVAFPHSTDILLSTMVYTNTTAYDEITRFFQDYFIFGEHIIIKQFEIDQTLEEKLKPSVWPPPHCLAQYHVVIDGNRRTVPPPKPNQGNTLRLKRLFLADLVWLHYIERMGIYRILGVILDDFATKGKFPIPNDKQLAIVLEAMVREMKTGEASVVRDRDSSYRRVCAWTSEAGRKLGIESVTNKAFNTLFHKFIQTALQYYKEKRLIFAVQSAGTTSLSPASEATVTNITETIKLLWQAFEPFNYGRNYSNTLSGIVWAIAGMAIVREVKNSIGIPSSYKNPEQYIPAAYDLLVLGKSITPSDLNRFTAHRDIAKHGRDILLDIEILGDSTLNVENSAIRRWLDEVEGSIEGYRSAYRSLTGVDLGAPGTPTIEQQA